MLQQRLVLPIMIGAMLMGLGMFVSLQSNEKIQAGGVMPPASFTSVAAPRTTSKTLYLPLVMNTCAGVDLLQDGGFEVGLPNAYWKTKSNVGSTILDNTSNPPSHSGTWKAWLGGNDSVQETVSQTLTIPAGMPSLRVSYWWRVDTFEGTHPFDFMFVQLHNASGTFTQTIETLSDGDANSVYRQSVLNTTGTWISQTMQIAFRAQTDTSNPTSFFIDDVSVQANCPAY